MTVLADRSFKEVMNIKNDYKGGALIQQDLVLTKGRNSHNRRPQATGKDFSGC